MGYNDENCIILSQKKKKMVLLMPNFFLFGLKTYYLNAKREKYNYDCVSLLLLDGCTSHLSDVFLDDCTF